MQSHFSILMQLFLADLNIVKLLLPGLFQVGVAHRCLARARISSDDLQGGFVEDETNITVKNGQNSDFHED